MRAAVRQFLLKTSTETQGDMRAAANKQSREKQTDAGHSLYLMYILFINIKNTLFCAKV